MNFNAMGKELKIHARAHQFAVLNKKMISSHLQKRVNIPVKECIGLQSAPSNLFQFKDVVYLMFTFHILQTNFIRYLVNKLKSLMTFTHISHQEIT